MNIGKGPVIAGDPSDGTWSGASRPVYGERLVGFPLRFDFFHALVVLACFSCLIDCVSVSFDGGRVVSVSEADGLVLLLQA